MVKEQRLNKHQVQEKQEVRDTHPITETMSADARRSGKNQIIAAVKNIESKLGAGVDVCQSVGQASHQDSMNIGDINSNLVRQTIDSLNDKQNPDSGNNADHIYSNTTLSKTPSISGQQLLNIQAAAKQFMISPNIFKKQKESRFKFAHSVDPFNAKNLQKQIDMFDGDEI